MTITAVVDYSAGNLASVKKALDWLGVPSIVASDPAQVAKAGRIIIPGVGNFAVTQRLADTGLRDAITDAIGAGRPLLGICLGMQWLFQSSREAPGVRGLGIFSGDCDRFPAGIKSPHVGWNALESRCRSRLLENVPASAFVYFSHSYRAPVVEHTVATCEYAGEFSAVVEYGRIFGVQFHPEKSGPAGLGLLSNFCHLPC
ncbi:MAG TPA: imidazole glycerol phosphate synthase subunit HisH [Terriglobales bacterium]|nr:imidazole glycerol phosphate synthase subunit HisH [Terriglobales bacterium]